MRGLAFTVRFLVPSSSDGVVNAKRSLGLHAKRMPPESPSGYAGIHSYIVKKGETYGNY